MAQRTGSQRRGKEADRATLRIDQLLWYLRFCKSRSQAQKFVAGSRIRVNGVRVIRNGHPVAIGDTITLPLRSGVKLMTIKDLPVRRGPADEARECYELY